MTFNLQYEQDYQRVMSAVINDSRNTIPAIKGQTGAVIYEYIQAQISTVKPGTLVYRIITENGNIAGFTAIDVVNGVATISLLQLRPAFGDFLSQISQIISNFISNNVFLQDILY